MTIGGSRPFYKKSPCWFQWRINMIFSTSRSRVNICFASKSRVLFLLIPKQVHNIAPFSPCSQACPGFPFLSFVHYLVQGFLFLCSDHKSLSKIFLYSSCSTTEDIGHVPTWSQAGHTTSSSFSLFICKSHGQLKRILHCQKYVIVMRLTTSCLWWGLESPFYSRPIGQMNLDPPSPL